MSKLGFSKEEIVALCAVEAFGIINRSLSFAWEHPSQFDNTYFQLISSKDTTKKPGLKSDTLFEKVPIIPLKKLIHSIRTQT
jgi:hypothetical protein